MTPTDLYAMTPERVEHTLEYLEGCYYNFLPEVSSGWLWHDKKPEQTRLEVRVVKHFDFDFRRFWRLATVWFDGRPFMITQNAGREGDDFAKRFVTDPAVYVEAVRYLEGLRAASFAFPGPEAESPSGLELTSFYSHDLKGYFEICGDA